MAEETNVVQSILESVKAIQEGHFVLTSGRHSEYYLNKDAIYVHPFKTAALCRRMAAKFYKRFPEVVLAPALGGIALSQWTASSLSYLLKYEVLALYAEKTLNQSDFILSRGYDKLIRGKRALIVEDVLTTGETVKKIIQLAEEYRATVVGVAAICNRGNVTASSLGVQDFQSLIDLSFETWEAEKCPLCEMGIPINIGLGKGAKF